METPFVDSFWWSWILLPILIFLSRIVDQTIGTLRIIFVSKGFRHIGPVLGFFEVIIWLLAVTQVLKHLTNPMAYIAYGAGFAMGNYIGIRLEEKISIGTALLRIIPKKETTTLVNHLREEGFGVTTVAAEGATGPVKIIFSIMKRKSVPVAIKLINEYNPNSFYTIEDIKAVKDGYFGMKTSGGFLPFKLFSRKSK